VSAPAPTRCPDCGTLAAEIVCHICKRDKRIAAPQAPLDQVERRGMETTPAVAAPDFNTDENLHADEVVRRFESVKEDADARGLHAAQFRHDVRAKIGAGRYP